MNDAQEIIPDGEIFVRGPLLEYVGPARPAAARPPAEKVIDGTHHVALPGLVNAHTHAAMTLFRGYADDMELRPWLETKIWPLEARLEPEDVYWGTALGAVEMIRSGVTTFNDMYWHFDQAAQAALDTGIRACPSGVLLGILPQAEQMVQEALAFVDQWHEAHPRIHVMFGPHAPYSCPDPFLKRIIAAAKERGLPIHIHLSEEEREVEESLRVHGRRPVEHMLDIGLFDVPVLAAHCNHLSAEEVQIFRDYGVGVAHNPGSNLKLATGFCPVPQLLAAGVTVGLGTDGAASNNNLDLLEETRLAALIHKAVTKDPTMVTAEQALRMATRGSAEALGLGDLIGSLTPGRRADLILVDRHRPHLWPGHQVVSDLVYSARAEDVTTVLIDGAIVLENRQLTRVDEEEIWREVKRRVARLTQQSQKATP